MLNNPLLSGRLKKYNPTRNTDHFEEINQIKKSKTCSCLNILKNRSINKKTKFEMNDNKSFSSRNKKYNLYKLNNKSSNCITPGSFNPLINYITKEEKIIHGKSNLQNKNKDHFYHMNPIELYKYKPQLKREKLNILFLSQILGLPGNSRNIITERKKSGKKIFNLTNKESNKTYSRNQSRKMIKFTSNKSNIFKNNNRKTIQYDCPIISYGDMIKQN